MAVGATDGWMCIDLRVEKPETFGVVGFLWAGYFIVIIISVDESLMGGSTRYFYFTETALYLINRLHAIWVPSLESK
jgi:hypothetical protein